MSKSSLGKYARWLLFAAERLQLEYGDSHVSLESLCNLMQQFEETIKYGRNSQSPLHIDVVRFMSLVVKWLTYMDKMNKDFSNKKNLFTAINMLTASKVRFHLAPLHDERLLYLNKLRDEGYSMNYIRIQAEFQLHIIQALKMTEPRIISRKEIQGAYIGWNKSSIMSRTDNNKYAKRRFIGIATRWFSFLNILKVEVVKKTSFDDALNMYEGWMKNDRGKAFNTIKKEMGKIRDFCIFLQKNNTLLQSVTACTMDSYIQNLSERNLTRTTIASYTSILRVFFRYAYNYGIVKHPIADSIQSPRTYSLSSIPYAPKWNDVEKLISSFSSQIGQRATFRDKAMVLLLAIYGMRSSEVCRIVLADIDWDNDLLILKRKKGGRQQILPLVPVVGNAIADYIKNERNNTVKCKALFLSAQAPYIPMNFKSLYAVVKRAYHGLDIDIKHYGPHSLRHACATHLVNNGHTLKEVADLLGHRKLDNTRIYAKVDMVNLRKVANMDWEGLL